MSTGTFGKLMERYGTEAEAEKIEEARQQLRRKKVARIKKGIFYLILVGIGVACWINRAPIVDASKKVYANTFGIASTATKSGEETKNKARELQDNAKKRADLIDDLLK